MINLEDFSKRFEAHKKEIDRRKKKEDNIKQKTKMLEKNPNYYKDAMKKSRKKQAEEDPVRKKESEEEMRRKILEKNPNYYKKAVEKSRKKQAEEDPVKKKETEEEIRRKILEKDLNYYTKAMKKSRNKHAEEDPVKKKESEKEVRKRMLDKNSNYYKEAWHKTKLKQQENMNETDRRRNFNLDVIFGPIFICSCCERKCYEKSVTQITQNFKEQVNNKRKNFYSFCIRQEIEIRIELNGNSDKTGSYICGTCKAAMVSGKVPSMASVNGLFLFPLHQDHQLTANTNLITIETQQ